MSLQHNLGVLHIYSILAFFLKLETILSLYLTEIKLISMQSAEGVFVLISFTSVFIECTADIFYLMDIQSLVFREVEEAKCLRAKSQGKRDCVQG